MISFLQGIVFGLAFVGAFFIMLNFFWVNLNYALIVTFFYIILCVMIMLFLKSILTKEELLRENKKQTSLLEEIKEKLNKDEKLFHN